MVRSRPATADQETLRHHRQALQALDAVQYRRVKSAGNDSAKANVPRILVEDTGGDGCVPQFAAVSFAETGSANDETSKRPVNRLSWSYSFPAEQEKSSWKESETYQEKYKGLPLEDAVRKIMQGNGAAEVSNVRVIRENQWRRSVRNTADTGSRNALKERHKRRSLRFKSQESRLHTIFDDEHLSQKYSLEEMRSQDNPLGSAPNPADLERLLVHAEEELRLRERRTPSSSTNNSDDETVQGSTKSSFEKKKEGLDTPSSSKSPSEQAVKTPNEASPTDPNHCPTHTPIQPSSDSPATRSKDFDPLILIHRLQLLQRHPDPPQPHHQQAPSPSHSLIYSLDSSTGTLEDDINLLTPPTTTIRPKTPKRVNSVRFSETHEIITKSKLKNRPRPLSFAKPSLSSLRHIKQGPKTAPLLTSKTCPDLSLPSPPLTPQLPQTRQQKTKTTPPPLPPLPTSFPFPHYPHPHPLRANTTRPTSRPPSFSATILEASTFAQARSKEKEAEASGMVWRQFSPPIRDDNGTKKFVPSSLESDDEEDEYDNNNNNNNSNRRSKAVGAPVAEGWVERHDWKAEDDGDVEKSLGSGFGSGVGVGADGDDETIRREKGWRRWLGKVKGKEKEKEKDTPCSHHHNHSPNNNKKNRKSFLKRVLTSTSLSTTISSTSLAGKV
ncbi:MAG: hypothetical protein M1834_003175 [Cirrosporium novae-zelandiae]|nr:MAG: hypothetical protein M1834_003175 [Cirrosporium novae-zelandiae]